ncbi:MAG TPA: NAD(P)H-hydrate dehydratase [Gemmataceae bacterium]|jgi:NAD(P)H-hydrate epimerase
MSNAQSSLTVVTEVPHLPPRPPDANKGTFGRVLIVSGSRGMSGAAVLCAGAALRGGAGLVRLAVPEGILPIIAAANPCYTTAPLPQDDNGRLSAVALPQLLELVRGNSVAALGAGLGQSDDIRAILVAVLEQTVTPLVLDADALNVLVGRLDALRKHQGPIVLTPHPGEFARLLGCAIPTVQARREELAAIFAATHGVVMVLKGHGTVVTDGRRVFVNTTGNPGMATGGSGDVLGGLIAALLGQKLETFAAAQLGGYLHGLAGDLASEQVGEVSLIASDLLHFLPRAFQTHAQKRQS